MNYGDFRRILAIDLGSVSVGVAFGDFSRVSAGFMPMPLVSFAMKGSVNAFCRQIFCLIGEYRVDTLVFGYPLSWSMAQKINHSDAASEDVSWNNAATKMPKNRSNHCQWRKKVKSLAKRMKNYVERHQKKENNFTAFRILLQDEHLTTYSARDSFFLYDQKNSLEKKLGKKCFGKAKKNFKKTKNIDSFAACEILLSCVADISGERPHFYEIK